MTDKLLEAERVANQEPEDNCTTGHVFHFYKYARDGTPFFRCENCHEVMELPELSE